MAEFNNLPPEIKNRIITYLDVESMYKLSQTNHLNLDSFKVQIERQPTRKPNFRMDKVLVCILKT